MPECALCLESIVFPANACTTKCGHKFHTSCLCQSVLYNVACPLCRADLCERPKRETDQFLVLDTEASWTLAQRILLTPMSRGTPPRDASLEAAALGLARIRLATLD